MVAYKVDDFYAPASDSGLIWNDPALGDRLAGRGSTRRRCPTRTEARPLRGFRFALHLSKAVMC